MRVSCMNLVGLADINSLTASSFMKQFDGTDSNLRYLHLDYHTQCSIVISRNTMGTQ